MEFDAVLASARLPETGVPLCLRGDLQLRHEQLEAELERAQDADESDDSLAGGGQARGVAEQIAALEAEMRDHTHVFALRGLPRQQYRDLLEQHPPREDHKEDMVWGADSRTFPVALIAACCTDPVMTGEQAGQLADVLTDGQLIELFSGALALNRVSVDVPKSVAASAILARPAPK